MSTAPLKPEDTLRLWPEAIQLLCENKACIMRIEDRPVVHGPSESFATPGIEVVRWPSKYLSQRLDPR